MKIDCHISPPDITQVPELAGRAEEMGFDGIWVSERTHSPYTLLTLAAEVTDDIDVGSAVALAFPRSPMVTAYTAWDVQQLADGRLNLGLGTQVKGHMERRFAVDFEWEQPGPRFREYVEALQHIWTAWQTDGEMAFEGEFYEITLCPDEWRPEHREITPPDIFVGGVNPYNLKLAGHRCEGLNVHALHSPRYIRESIRPNIETGADIGDRDVDDVVLTGAVFVITGDDRSAVRESVREEIAFYGATRTYRPLFDIHGWGEVCDTLCRLADENRWDELSDHVTDEMLSTFCVEADWPDLRDALEARYDGLLDRVTPVPRFDGTEKWSHLTT